MRPHDMVADDQGGGGVRYHHLHRDDAADVVAHHGGREVIRAWTMHSSYESCRRRERLMFAGGGLGLWTTR